MRKFCGEYLEWGNVAGGVVIGDGNEKYSVSVMPKKVGKTFLNSAEFPIKINKPNRFWISVYIVD
jgi:hypothetical protein